jgi:aromatic-L-amino-acid/L-tryptophan decarboxylase
VNRAYVAGDISTIAEDGPSTDRAGAPVHDHDQGPVTRPAGAHLPLDPGPGQARALLEQAVALLAGHHDGLAHRPANAHADPTVLIERLARERPGSPRTPEEVFAVLTEVVGSGRESTSGGELAYIPGSGLLTSAVAELVASGLNRYTGVPGIAPAAVALEAGVLRWLCDLFDLPGTAQGILLSGGSIANLSAIVAARDRLGATAGGRVYVGAQAHASVRKAARIAGLWPDQVRVCPAGDGLRLDVEAVRLAIKEDLADGHRPTAIVAAAGTTNAGAIDPLCELADLAEEFGAWLHVDAAYGGFFQLTERGRERLAGIERADSITLDPHKSLFLPFGTGALLVRDRADLHRSFAEDADYLRDLDDTDDLPDFSQLTPELTRAWRGLRLWLPLQLHGVETFRAALDDKLDLAEAAWHRLDADPRVNTWGRPDLSVVAFRVHGDDAAQDAVLERVNGHGPVRLSSTVIDDAVALRLAVLSHRTDATHVGRALDLVDRALAV